MRNKNRRRFKRINLQWVAALDFGLRTYECYLDNLSLSGFHVSGIFNQSIGDFCFIRLKPDGLYINTPVTGVCSVSRSDHVGIALEFHTMRLDRFFILQTSLLNKGLDPSALMFGNEFLESEILDFDDKIILFRTYGPELQVISQ